MDGNTSDATWMAMVFQQAALTLPDVVRAPVLFVADSKAPLKFDLGAHRGQSHLLLGRLRVSRRQSHLDDGPAFGVVFGRHRPVMLLHHFMDDGKPESA